MRNELSLRAEQDHQSERNEGRTRGSDCGELSYLSSKYACSDEMNSLCIVLNPGRLSNQLVGIAN